MTVGSPGIAQSGTPGKDDTLEDVSVTRCARKVDQDVRVTRRRSESTGPGDPCSTQGGSREVGWRGRRSRGRFDPEEGSLREVRRMIIADGQETESEFVNLDLSYCGSVMESWGGASSLRRTTVRGVRGPDVCRGV